MSYFGDRNEKGMFVLYLAAGALTGLIAAGGASAVWILAPFFLVTARHLSAYDVVGISLAVEFVLYLFLFCIKGGAYRLNWKTLIVGTLPLVLGSVAGSYVSRWIPGQVFVWILFASTLVAGVVLFICGQNMFGKTEETEVQPYHPWRYVWWMLLAGLMSGAFGIGSAVISVLAVASTKKFSVQMELGTGMFLIALSAMAGYITHSVYGTVHLMEVVVCAVFALALFRLTAIFMNTKSNVYTQFVGVILLLAAVILVPIYLFV